MVPALAVLLLWGAKEPKNLVPNGDFEKGREGIPLNWQRPDGLTSFWIRDPRAKSYVLKIDTDVLKDQYRARQKELKKNPLSPAPKKLPTKGKKYSTVAATEGVAYWSDWIPVKKGVTYKLSVDVRVDSGKKSPKVFVKGYVEDKNRPPGYRRRVAYKKYLNCKATSEWKTFGMEFNPTLRTPGVKWVRVMIFAYWPPGTYYFDNVKIYEAGKGKGEKRERKRSFRNRLE